MATDTLIQGKTYAWLVDDTGHALVTTTDASAVKAVRMDVVSDTISYLGKADVGSLTSAASWQLSRITTDVNGGVVIEYADGDALFDNVWDNRASASYS